MKKKAKKLTQREIIKTCAKVASKLCAGEENEIVRMLDYGIFSSIVATELFKEEDDDE